MFALLVHVSFFLIKWALVLFLTACLFLRYIFFPLRKALFTNFAKKSASTKVIGLFHPYSNGGGGGERVLWCLVQAIQQQNKDCDIVLYTGDNLSCDVYRQKVKVC